MRRPADLEDSAGWSRLARALGVDYLITGAVTKSGNNRIEFTVCFYSSSNPAFIYMTKHESELSSISNEVRKAAIDITGKIGISAVKFIPGNQPKDDARTLGIVEDALRYLVPFEADCLNIYKGRDLIYTESSKPNAPAYVCGLDMYYGSWSISSGSVLKSEKIVDQESGNFMLKRAVLERCNDGYAYAKMKRYAEDWLKMDPSSAIAHAYVIAAKWQVDGKLEGIKPDFSALGWRRILELAQIYDITSQFTTADELIKYARAEKPNSAYMRNVIGSIYSNSICSREPLAIPEYMAGLQLNPGSYRMLIQLGTCYMHTDRTQEAQAVVDKLLAKWPDRTDGHFMAAKIYDQNDQRDRMMDEYAKVRQIDPEGLILSKDFMAKQYYQSGKVIPGFRELLDARPELKKSLFAVIFLVCTILFICLAVVGFSIRALIISGKRFNARQQEKNPGDSSV